MTSGGSEVVPNTSDNYAVGSLSETADTSQIPQALLQALAKQVQGAIWLRLWYPRASSLPLAP